MYTAQLYKFEYYATLSRYHRSNAMQFRPTITKVKRLASDMIENTEMNYHHDQSI